MKRFLIHVSTYWCGMDDTFRAVAESEMELWDLAEQLAYDNFQSYSCENDIAEEEGYDPDEMEESDWDELWSRVDESTYYSFSIEEGEVYERKRCAQRARYPGPAFCPAPGHRRLSEAGQPHRHRPRYVPGCRRLRHGTRPAAPGSDPGR